MNLILKNSHQIRYYADMLVIFQALRGEAEKLNWLITDFECNYWPDQRLTSKVLFISGLELLAILNKYSDLQFIWGVFSGFTKETIIDFSDETILPYADGNLDLNNKDRVPQHPDAIIEIIICDSSEIFFTSNNKKLIDLFRSTFTDAKRQ